jgi:hypothetical protein
VRCFQPFGSLLKKRAEVRALIKSLLDVKPACECGCADWHIMTPCELDEFMLSRYVRFKKPSDEPQPCSAGF